MNNLFPPVPNVDNVTDIHSWGLVRDWLTKVTLLLNNNPPVALGGMQGLIGANNAATPNSAFNFSATVIVLRNRLGAGQFLSLGPGYTFSCDLTIQGVGGRDQATAFGPNTWVHFYLIFNPTSNQLTTMVSLAAQDQGPVLPSGYSHFAYLGAVRLDGAGNLRKGHIAGTLFTYDDPTSSSILAAGQSLTPVSVSAAAFVPPNATSALYTLSMNVANAAAGAFASYWRPTGQAVMYQLVDAYIQTAGATNSVIATVELAPGVGQSLDYNINAVPTTGGAYALVAGYRMPNSAS